MLSSWLLLPPFNSCRAYKLAPPSSSLLMPADKCWLSACPVPGNGVVGGNAVPWGWWSNQGARSRPRTRVLSSPCAPASQKWRLRTEALSTWCVQSVGAMGRDVVGNATGWRGLGWNVGWLACAGGKALGLIDAQGTLVTSTWDQCAFSWCLAHQIESAKILTWNYFKL